MEAIRDALHPDNLETGGKVEIRESFEAAEGVGEYVIEVEARGDLGRALNTVKSTVDELLSLLKAISQLIA